MPDDIWNSEHLPVLREAVTGLNRDGIEHGGPSSADISAAVGLPPARVVMALERLADGALLEIRIGTREHARVVGASSAGQERAGAWPSAEVVADRLIATLEDIAENDEDEGTRSKARKALDGLTGFSRDVLVSVAGAAAGIALA